MHEVKSDFSKRRTLLRSCNLSFTSALLLRSPSRSALRLRSLQPSITRGDARSPFLGRARAFGSKWLRDPARPTRHVQIRRPRFLRRSRVSCPSSSLSPPPLRSPRFQECRNGNGLCTRLEADSITTIHSALEMDASRLASKFETANRNFQVNSVAGSTLQKREESILQIARQLEATALAKRQAQRSGQLPLQDFCASLSRHP